jgi:uncharacterized membrane protein
MQSRAQIAGHPLHPIFVTIPIGLWSFVPICDLIYLFGWGDASWKSAAFYCVGGGILGAVPAIITGLIDYPLAANPKAAKVAQFHLYLNVTCTLLFIVSFILRYREFPASFGLLPAAITLIGAVLLGLSGYLGGELVSRFGISVHRDAIASEK